MGSFRVAGMMAGSPLGAGVEVKTAGRAETSSCREQRLSYISPSPPTAPDRKVPTLAQTHRNPLCSDIHLAPAAAHPWLG